MTAAPPAMPTDTLVRAGAKIAARAHAYRGVRRDALEGTARLLFGWVYVPPRSEERALRGRRLTRADLHWEATR